MSEVVFKRTKSKPAQRTRPSSPEPDGLENREQSPSALATKLKNKAKKAKPKARLSFGGDDDEEDKSGEVFQVKKSNLSRKLTLGTHPALQKSTLPTSLDQATISSRSGSGPTYDKAHINELKASTPTSRPPLPKDDPYDADMSMDAGDISIQSIQTIDVFDESHTLIPSESSIKVAKERRERLRKTGVPHEDDFISLTVTRRADEPPGPHPESRLVREEDEIGEGDDEFAEYTSAQERIALGKKSRKVEASKRRDAMKEMIADAEEVDDETAEWEMEQLRRGGHKTPEQLAEPVKAVYKATPIPPSTPLPTLSTSIAQLTRSLNSLTASHATNTSSLSALVEEREQVNKREVELRGMVEMAEEKRSWFEAFREWVESVATFLDEKFPQVERLEEEHLSLLRERADMITKRRRDDDLDDLSLFAGRQTPEAMKAAAEEEKIEETEDLGGKPDRSMRRAERTGRRNSRLMRFPALYNKRKLEKEGYSTDGSLDESNADAYSEVLKTLAHRANAILADVRAPEFRNPNVKGKGKGQSTAGMGLAGWWGRWREGWEDIYIGAWGGLGLVGAWEFWVRLEIVGWDCIHDARSLDSFTWYQGLYDFSHPGPEDEPFGPDGDLVSAMISTAIIPRLCRLVESGALDVYSKKDVKRMVDLAEEIEASVEADNAKLQSLLQTVLATFSNAVLATKTLILRFPALGQHSRRPPITFTPESIPARERFYARQVKLLQNLLIWRKYTGERFGVGTLAEKLVMECIYIVGENTGSWENGEGLTSLEYVAEFLPPELLPHEMKTKLDLWAPSAIERR